jgi:hypothetical protein
MGDVSIEVSSVLCLIEAHWPLTGSFCSKRHVRLVARRLSKILAEVSGGVDVASVRDRIAEAFPNP